MTAKGLIINGDVQLSSGVTREHVKKLVHKINLRLWGSFHLDIGDLMKETKAYRSATNTLHSDPLTALADDLRYWGGQSSRTGARDIPSAAAEALLRHRTEVRRVFDLADIYDLQDLKEDESPNRMDMMFELTEHFVEDFQKMVASYLNLVSKEDRSQLQTMLGDCTSTFHPGIAKRVEGIDGD